MIQHTESIRRCFAAATPEALAGGRAWYGTARQTVFILSMEYGITERKAAGIVAALSQRTRWSTNIDRARAVLEGSDDPGGLYSAATKAVAIRDGADPLAVLGSRAFKVTAFYLALCGDDDAAVVDTWMLAAFSWTQGYSRLQYKRLAAILRREARKLGLTTTEYQAVIWCQVRGAIA